MEGTSDRPLCFSSTLQECGFVLTAALATAQTSLFGGLITCMTSQIAEDLGMNITEVTWLSAAQALAAGSFLLFFGRVADLFGRRVILCFGMTCYAAVLLVAGFATNPIFLDAFCGILGLCSAATVPAAVGILGATYSRPSGRKNKAFACFSCGNPVGFGVGALLSGFITRLASWRASLWTLAVIYGFVAALSWWTVPLDRDGCRDSPGCAMLGRLDWVGAIAIILGVALLLCGIMSAATAPDGWLTNYILAFLCFGIVLMAGFVAWQGMSSNPLMPLYMWKDRNFTLLTAIISLGYAAFSSNMFFLALLLQKVKAMSTLMVAVHLLPQVIVGVSVNVFAGLVMHQVSHKWLLSAGVISYVAAFTLLSVMHEDWSYWASIFPALCLSVVGADLEFTVTNMYIMSSLPVAQQSVAGGLFTTVMRLSSSIGLAISTAVFNSVSGPSADGERLSSDYDRYRATFFVALIATGLAVILLPFLTIKSQGRRSQEEQGLA